MKRIVVAYSGGLETSAAIARLAERASSDGTEVVAVILDLGRRDELVDERERALALGAVRCHVVDVREDFVRRYILPALQAGAFADERFPMITAIARPLIAKSAVDIARMEGAGAVLYGGSDLNRASLDALVRSLNPDLESIVPARILEMSDEALIDYARAHEIPVNAGLDRQKISANLWGRSVVLDPDRDSWSDVPEETYLLTRSVEDSPGRPAYIELEFQAGIPSRVNGIEMPFVEMIESLEILGGTHGVGRSDILAARADGTKCREIGEAPAAALLQLAQRELRSLALDAEIARKVEDTGRAYADAIQHGEWFSPSRAALEAFVASVQPALTGSIRLRLFKGDCRVAGRRAVSSLVTS
jgi:argininosuccinate synthase